MTYKLYGVGKTELIPIDEFTDVNSLSKAICIENTMMNCSDYLVEVKEDGAPVGEVVPYQEVTSMQHGAELMMLQAYKMCHTVYDVLRAFANATGIKGRNLAKAVAEEENRDERRAELAELTQAFSDERYTNRILNRYCIALQEMEATHSMFNLITGNNPLIFEK